MKQLLLIFIFFSLSANLCAQTKKKQTKAKKDTIFADDLLNPLSPAKAAFYSAVLPGLGQVYNKKYWKIPIVYAALGTSTYFYFRNNSFYNVYRNAFKLRLAGKPDEFKGVISDDRPINNKVTFRPNIIYTPNIGKPVYGLSTTIKLN